MRCRHVTGVAVLLILVLIGCRSLPGVPAASGSEGVILETGLDDVSSSGWKEVAKADQLLAGIQCLAGSDVCYVGGADTVLKTNDGGETWSRLHPGIPSGSTPLLTCADDSTCYVAGCRFHPTGCAAAIVRTRDGGKTWVTVHTAEAPTAEARTFYFWGLPDLHDLHCPLGSDVCYAVTTTSRLLRCSTWEDLDCLLKDLLWRLLRRPQSLMTLLKTTDGGYTWSAVYAEKDILMTNMQCRVDSDTCYALRSGYSFIERDYVVKSTNGGENWSRVHREASALLRSLTCPNEDTCYAVGQHRHTEDSPPPGDFIIKTEDAGQHWWRVISGLKPPVYSVYCWDELTCYAPAGGIDAILKTVDGGAHWSMQRVGTDVHISTLSISCSDATTCCATTGVRAKILRTTTGGETDR